MSQAAFSRWASAALIIATFLVLATEAQAGWIGPGCWVCESSSGWNANKRCYMVGHQESGTGTDCYRGPDLMGEWCYTNGTYCYNTEVDGGGGGGGGMGGGSGSSCTVPHAAACPADCFSCQRVSF